MVISLLSQQYDSSCSSKLQPAHQLLGKLSSIGGSSFGLCLILAVINLICYYRSLGGYFLADDFVHVTYLTQVIPRHPELLLSNFYSNWMQTEGTQFYRPFISLTLAFDYLVWGANAFGFHLSNTLYQIAASILLFLTSRRMLSEFSRRQATTVAFFAAALFAGQPLHPEVVSWIIGRVDSVCAVFFLASFWLFLRATQQSSRLSAWMSYGAFALSLLSKEMAVVLPPTLSLYVFVAQPGGSSMKQRLFKVVSQTGIFWLMLFAYLGIRTAALGTLTGGYTGSVGQGLTNSWAKRFLDGSLLTLLFPFNAEIFSPRYSLRRLLAAIYALGALSVVVRMGWSWTAQNRISGLTRYVAFASGWLILCLLPTYQVWNLTASLQGSRFAYLATAPLCLLLALTIYPLTDSNLNSRFLRACKVLATVLLCVLLGSWMSITYCNNLCWAQAGKQVRSFRAAIERVVNRLHPSQKLVVMNVPQKHQGAHMIYNGAMLSVLMNPPLSTVPLAPRVLSFEPMTYGDPDLLIVARLKELLKTPEKFAFYKWDAKQLKLQSLNLSTGISTIELPVTFGGLDFKDICNGQMLVSPALDAAAVSVDFIDLTLSCEPLKTAESMTSFITVCWTGATGTIFHPDGCLSQKLIADGRPHHYRFAVSQHKSWILSQRITRLGVIVPIGSVGKLLSVQLSNGQREMPVLQVDPQSIRSGEEGTYRFNSNSGSFFYDAEKILHAKQAVLELSKPNSWFEHYSGDYRDARLSSQALKRWKLNGLKGKFDLAANQLPSAAYYQVRLAALDADGQVAGYVSDPINLQISSQQVNAGRNSLRQAAHAK